MAIAVVVFLVTALLQGLWNTTMPQVFHGKLITFGQAFRLLLISALLISGGLLPLVWNHSRTLVGSESNKRGAACTF